MTIGNSRPLPCGRSSSGRRRCPLPGSALRPPAPCPRRCAAPRRSPGTRCRRRAHTAAPVPPRAAGWQAPVHRRCAARSRRAPASPATSSFRTPDAPPHSRPAPPSANTLLRWRWSRLRSCRARRSDAASRRPAACRARTPRECDADGRRRLNPFSVLRPKRYAHSSRSSSLIAKKGPRSVANTDSSSSGHSTAASAARIASISSRSWKAPAHEHVRNAARLERLDVGPRHVRLPADETPEEQADVLGAHRDRWLAAALGDLPAALVDDPLDHRPHCRGQRLVDRDARHVSSRVRRRHRQHHDRGLTGQRPRLGASGTRMAPAASARRRSSPARTPRSRTPGSPERSGSWCSAAAGAPCAASCCDTSR